MKPLLVTSGEPAGIGPDLCLELAGHPSPLIVLGNKSVLEDRAKQLGKVLTIEDYSPSNRLSNSPNVLTVLSLPCKAPVVAGHLNSQQADYVLKMLTLATDRCIAGEFSGLVTAPVHKGVINKAGIAFTGHTEFLAQRCQVKTVVMLLVSKIMRVALVTTHLPLKEVPAAITQSLLNDVLMILNQSLQRDFAILAPKILVAGLNPHAGEGGYFGREEIEVITPVINRLQQKGLFIEGPFPADTMFSTQRGGDAYVSMYHDQGLSVVKYADFDHAVNVTLGLPIVRTSVDHGTALELAGTGKAKATSLLAAVEVATQMVMNRESLP